MHFMYEAAQENAAAVQRMYFQRAPVEIWWIAEQLIVFMCICARVDRSMLRGVIRALVDITDFLLRKK